MTKKDGSWTTMVVKRKVHDDLKVLGEASESFNTVLERLLLEKRESIEAIKQVKAKQ